MTQDSPFCQACGTWTCPDCGWQRHRANLVVFQDCPRCGGGSNEDSSFARTRHRKQTWQQHNPAIGPLCADIFPDGRIELCEHASCHTIEWGNVDRDMRAALTWDDDSMATVTGQQQEFGPVRYRCSITIHCQATGTT